MKNKLQRLFSRLKDDRGSATTEMLGSIAIICVIIVNCLMILGYTIQQNQVSYAAKRLARSIEVCGYITENLSEENNMLKTLLPNATAINAQVMSDTVSSVTVYGRDSSAGVTRLLIQLREMAEGGSNPSDFTIHVRAYYTLPLAVFGATASMQEQALDQDSSQSGIQIKLPINVYVNGQSEVYWKLRQGNWS